jgi:predicted O-methyltransferase YrrM
MWAFATTARGNMAEVGCWYGRTTVLLLAASEPALQLHCVDTFRGSEEHQEELKGKTYREDFERNIASLRGQRGYVMEGFSHEIAALYPDRFFDYVWIDAAHDYENVKRDIESWYPKLKSGGVLFGHDYPEPTDPNGGFEELTKAVNETVRDDRRFGEFGWFCGVWGARKL